MKLSHEQFREQLVSYLYGELEGEALQAFESCLAESESCRHELAEAESTLARARKGLRASESDPPARVRTALLAAAAAQVASTAGKGEPPTQAPAAPLGGVRGVRGVRPGPTPGLTVVRRVTPWVATSLAVAAAVALFVRGTRAPREGTGDWEPAPLPSLAPAEPPLELAPPPPPKRKRKEAAPELQAIDREGEQDDVAPRSRAAAKEERGAAAARPRESAQRSLESAPERAFAKKARSEPARSPVAAAPPAEDEAFAAAPAPPAAAAPTRTPLPAPAPAEISGAPPAESEGELMERSARPAPLTAHEAELMKGRPASTEELVASLLRSAEAHASAGRTREAIDGYRELLRRFPRHAERPRWQKRLSALRAQEP